MIRSTLFAAALLAAGLLAGCQKDQHADAGKGSTTASADVCDKCAGVQHGLSDGRCEVCGDKVDFCLKCEGVQKPTADGKCPVCKEDISSKPAAAPATRPAGP
jgi:hypothetical protein